MLIQQCLGLSSQCYFTSGLIRLQASDSPSPAQMLLSRRCFVYIAGSGQQGQVSGVRSVGHGGHERKEEESRTFYLEYSSPLYSLTFKMEPELV